MEKTPIHKKVAAIAVALALSVSVIGGVGYASTAHAANSSSNSSISKMSEESLIALLQDLIKLLENRLQALIDARGTTTTDTNGRTDDNCATTTDTGLTELEADVFTNETVVKIELDGVKQVFTTDATTRGDIADAILTEFTELSDSEVSDALVIEREDRESRASDKLLSSFGSNNSKVCDDSTDDNSTVNDDDNDDDEDHHNGSDDDDDGDRHGSNSGHGSSNSGHGHGGGDD